MVPGHGGRVLQRVRSGGTDGLPLEIQLLEFPSQQALDAFMADDRRQSLAGERDKAVSKTEVIEVQIVLEPSDRAEDRPRASPGSGQTEVSACSA